MAQHAIKFVFKINVFFSAIQHMNSFKNYYAKFWYVYNLNIVDCTFDKKIFAKQNDN